MSPTPCRIRMSFATQVTSGVGAIAYLLTLDEGALAIEIRVSA
jgi:hypothetical protein